MEIFREIDLMKNTKKTILKISIVKTGEEKTKTKRCTFFGGWQFQWATLVLNILKFDSRLQL